MGIVLILISLIFRYGADGNTLEVLTVTSENPKAAICYGAGGQMLASKFLRFLWE